MVCTGSSQNLPQSASGVALSALLALAFCGPTLAQSASPTSPPAAPAAPSPAANSSPQATGFIPANTPGANANIQQFDEESYVLGTGDILIIELFGQPELLGQRPLEVLIDGTVSLPMIGNVPVRGLTIKQAAAAISTRYARYFKRPVVTVRLDSSRPITIGVSGEVNRPGTYILGQNRRDTSTALGGTGAGAVPVPKVSLLLQTAGGITARADIRNVVVRRPQANGGSDTIINVNLWRILKDGDLSQDLMLRDGDSIFVPTSNGMTAAESQELAKATFSPPRIVVNVVGEVRQPGPKELPPNTPLNNAIMAAGGFIPTRAKKDSVTLYRLNPDGTVTERVVEFDLAKGISADGNPTLQNNDVVVIGRSGLAGFSDTLGSILSPFNSLTGAFFRFIPGF